MKNLLCCDSFEELQILKGICGSDYVIATNKYPFYKEIRNNEEQAIFLESSESNPYETVWDILDQIHHVIDGCKDIKYSRLFHLSYHIEGGMPTKFVQTIINLNLISRIVKMHGIKSIYLFDNSDNWMINESIYLYSRAYHIECHIIDKANVNRSCIEKECLKTLQTMDAKQEDIEHGELGIKEKERFENIKSRPTRIVAGNAIESLDVGLLYCMAVPYNKHVDWCLRRVEAIGHETRVICYYDTEDVQKFKDKGLQVDCLEDYFSADEFVREYSKLVRERRDILKALACELHVAYKGVELSDYLTLKIRNHYFRELIEYLYIDICSKKYFRYHKFSYIHLWGDTNYWGTWICYDNTRDNASKLFKIDGISFITFESKQPHEDMLSAVFTPNKKMFRLGLSADYSGNIFEIYDVFFGKKYDFSMVFPSQRNKFKIGFLPTGVLSGFTTYQFYYGTLMRLIDRLLEEKYEVIFKNHPYMSECWEEDVKYKYKDERSFKFVDPLERIDKVLEICDVVITDTSCAAVDAAMAKKPVFCIVDDQGYHLIGQHEKGFSIYQSIDALISDMNLVLDQDNIYKGMVKKQSAYLSKLLGENSIIKKGEIYSVLQKNN